MNEILGVPAAALAAIRTAIIEGEATIGYPELAKRLGVSVATCKRMVSARIIRPMVNMHKVKRFHWPSVVAQMQRGV